MFSVENLSIFREIVRLGDLDLDPNVNDGAEPINIPIEHVIKHEHYNRNEITNDIALLKLTNIVSFSSKFILINFNSFKSII